MVIMERKKLTYLFGIIKKRISIIILLLGFISLVRTFFLLFNSFLPDFSVFYYSTRDLLDLNNPYINNHLFTQLNYPPLALLFLMPISLFEFSVSSKLWLVISILFFLVTLVILYKIKPISFNFLTIIFLASVISFPFKFTLGMGQINILAMFLIALLLFFVYKKNSLLGSISLSLSIAIKLFPLILFLPLLIQLKYKIVLLSVAFLILLFLLSILILGKDINLYYFDSILLPLIYKPAGEVYYNQSLSGFLSRIDFLNLYTMQGGRLVLSIVSIIVILKKKYDLILSLCLFIVLILMINNFSWQHHLVLLLIPYYFILSINRKNKLNLFFIIMSYLLIAINIKNPVSLENIWYGNIILSHGFLGTLTLWLLYIFNYKKIA